MYAFKDGFFLKKKKKEKKYVVFMLIKFYPIPSVFRKAFLPS